MSFVCARAQWGAGDSWVVVYSVCVRTVVEWPLSVTQARLTLLFISISGAKMGMSSKNGHLLWKFSLLSWEEANGVAKTKQIKQPETGQEKCNM